MASHSDDCYFFYNSTCAKGEECPFRHEPQALGSETMCDLWENGNCFRQRCKFRHTVIEKKRSQTACYYETQASGCLKPHCPFQHTKPRPGLPAPGNPPSSLQTPTQPVLPAPAQQKAAGPPMDTNQMSIPVLGRGSAPYYHFQQAPFHPRGPPPMGFNMPGGNPHMLRPPGTMRYPRFGGVPQPMDRGHGYGHAPLRPPMHFGRGGPAQGGIYPNMPYPPMHMGREMAEFRPALPEKTYQRDESGSSDFSDYSSTSEDEGGRRSSPRPSSRRKVQSSRREGSRRVVKSNRRHHQPADKQHRGGSEDRKRTNKNRSREKSPDSGWLKERGRDKDRDRRKRSKEHGKESNDKEQSKPKERRKDSGEEDMDSDTNSPDIKVKTLEEILRDKALKKLEERRAELKVQKENEEAPEKLATCESTEEQASPTNGVEKDSASSENEEEEMIVKNDDETKEKESERPKRESEETGIDKESDETDARKDSKEARKESETTLKKDLKSRLAPSSADKFKVKTLEEILREKKRRKAESQQSNVEQAESVAEQCATTKPVEPKVLKSVVSPSKVPLPAGKRPGRVTKQKEACQDKLPEESNKSGAVKARRVIRVLKTAAQPSNTGVQEGVDTKPEQQENKPTQVKKILRESTPKQDVRVKSFEEIMQEKRMRRSQEEKKEEVKKEEVKKEEVEKDAPLVATGAASLPEKNKVASVPLLGKSKSLPVIKSRKIKVVRRTAAKSEETKEGSRPTSPARSISDPTTTEKTAPERTATATTTTATTTTKVSVVPARDSQPVEQNYVEPELPVADVKTCETVSQPMLVKNKVGSQECETTQPVIVAEVKEHEKEDCANKSPNKRLISAKEEKESDDLLNDSSKQDDENKAVYSSLDVTVHDLPAKRPKTDPPSYEEIVHAVSQSSHMTEKDDFFDDLFSDAIGSLSPAGSGEEYADLHEDDLIMELEDMINE